jgi:hypothetical protein
VLPLEKRPFLILKKIHENLTLLLFVRSRRGEGGVAGRGEGGGVRQGKGGGVGQGEGGGVG